MKNQIIVNEIEKFCDSVDVQFQKDFVAEYEKFGDSKIYGGKHCGSDAEHAGAEYIADCLRKIGASKVELHPCETSRFQFNDATLTLEGEEKAIKPYGYVAPGTEETLKAEIIDVNKATKADYAEIDAEGKIVLFAAMGTLEGANLSGQIHESLLNGAAAMVIYAVEDVLDEDTIRVQPPNVISDVPIVGISGRDAAWIKEQIAAGKNMAALDVDAEYIPRGGVTYNVTGEIPGTVSDEKIIYTAHLDHYFRCLQDNMSSCSTLLGIAKAMIDCGYRPNRTIVFAFHGSHETGAADTRYPYIHGSYKLTQQKMEEWSGKALVNFNFEYTALKVKKLQPVGYMGSNNLAAQYFGYSPELTGKGYETKIQNPPQQEYYMLSWSDCISYHTAGIPTFCNDCITDQLYSGEGPYVGRDHSNMDNWDIFDTEVLKENSRYYGSFGIYMDQTPYEQLDFTEQAARIRNEVNKELLDSLGISHDSYFAAVDELEKAAAEAKEKAEAKNEAYIKALSEGMDEETKKKYFEDAASVNGRLLAVYKLFADEIDRINQYDFLTLSTVKYLQVIEMLQGTKALIEAEDIDKAFEALAGADLAISSYYFSEEVADHMKMQISEPEGAKDRNWSRGRELHVDTLYDLVAAFSGGDIETTMTLLDKYTEEEASYLPESMEREQAAYVKAAEILKEI